MARTSTAECCCFLVTFWSHLVTPSLTLFLSDLCGLLRLLERLARCTNHSLEDRRGRKNHREGQNQSSRRPKPKKKPVQKTLLLCRPRSNEEATVGEVSTKVHEHLMSWANRRGPGGSKRTKLFPVFFFSLKILNWTFLFWIFLRSQNMQIWKGNFSVLDNPRYFWLLRTHSWLKKFWSSIFGNFSSIREKKKFSGSAFSKLPIARKIFGFFRKFTRRTVFSPLKKLCPKAID